MNEDRLELTQLKPKAMKAEKMMLWEALTSLLWMEKLSFFNIIKKELRRF